VIDPANRARTEKKRDRLLFFQALSVDTITGNGGLSLLGAGRVGSVPDCCGGAPARTFSVDTSIMLPILVRSFLRYWCAIAGAYGMREMETKLEELQR